MTTTDELLAGARTRFIGSIGAARDAADETDGRVAHYAIEALTSVMPQMPACVEERIDAAMGTADARIFTRAELRKFLAETAIEILLTQAAAVERWLRVRRKRRAGGMARVADHRR